MTDASALDRAHAEMITRPEDEAARRAYYHRLAAAELCLLLDREPEGDDLAPTVAGIEEGQFVLAFDGEERLAAFADGPVPYAALPGRVIVGLLAGQGIGIGVNLGSEETAFLMNAEAVDWLADLLAAEPEAGAARPVGWAAPARPDAAAALSAALSGLGAFAEGGWLATVRYGDGRVAMALVIEGAAPGAEGPLAKAAAEALALTFGPGEADVLFLSPADCTRLDLAAFAAPVILTRPVAPATAPAPAAPGSDPDRPPRLR
ncbi:SseB family protein [Frigidibacter sp. RF13]|uniref:SseB family protein n=1 Tax=Frigidibacter sp. RF13 TaxID=2997340 RepID=UPI002270F904|nr:SseB family protein [Frigidibacter sp. RF13]MCY1126403.1 SseB family protein [Frigidibacter sp. RF13]